jgi:FlaA1/EpsC-like NDP-sugar epimerase
MKIFLKQISRLNSWRISFAVLHDAMVTIFAWIVAYQFRFNFDIPPKFVLSLNHVIIWAVPLQLFFYFQFGLYKGIWRFASLPDLERIIAATLTSTLVIAFLLLFIKPSTVVPRSVVLMVPLILILWLGGSRFFYRVWKDYKIYGRNHARGKPVLLIGTGESLVGILKELKRSTQWQVVGLILDSRKMHGLHLQGVKVLGGLDKLAHFSNFYGVEDVIIAMPSHARIKKRSAIEFANELGLNVFTMPAFDDIMRGRVNISQIRRVEVEDLLGRDVVKLDNTGLHKMLDGNTVLVTGAGGSIGSELCRQILHFQPAVLVCLDLSEFALYSIEQEFTHLQTTTKLIFLTGDVKNAKRVQSILQLHKPAVVFHAAAYKHVPLMENGNVWEALSNNVIGTHTIAKACQQAGVDKFVLVSTDKAVNPTNVMGVSKRLAEMVCQGLQNIDGLENAAPKTQFVIVRFGNVLGSSGSVIPKFREQIAKGGPVTITHPDITRYFMSISEASQLVMQAGLLGNGGEIFVLDMGEPVKIADLAKDMIRLSGLHQDEIEVVFTGLRPGEKLYEELLADDETTIPTAHEKLRIANSRTVDKSWLENLLKWMESAQGLTEEQIKFELKYWVEEYQYQSAKGVELSYPDNQITLTIH